MTDSGYDKNNVETPKRRYIVTGAAGHLGCAIMHALLNAGEEAYGLLLPGQTAMVSGPHITYFHGDVCEIESLRCLFESADGKDLIVIHTAAMISIAEKIPPKLYEVNVNGTKNILKLCKEYHVKRLVHVSSVHAIPEAPDGATMKEMNSYSADRVVGGYAKTKAEAVQAVLDAAEEGLDAVVVFPSGILGPYDGGNNHLTQMVAECLQGKIPVCVKGGYDIVDVRDVAAGCLQAAEYGRKGEGYILSGHYIPLSRLMAMVRSSAGRTEIPVIPTVFARIAVPFIEMYASMRHRRPLYTRYSLHTIGSNSNFSNQKAREELGYSTRSLGETIADTISWLKGLENK